MKPTLGQLIYKSPNPPRLAKFYECLGCDVEMYWTGDDHIRYDIHIDGLTIQVEGYGPDDVVVHPFKADDWLVMHLPSALVLRAKYDKLLEEGLTTARDRNKITKSLVLIDPDGRVVQASVPAQTLVGS